MATKFANIKGLKFLEEPQGENRGGTALVSFDLIAGTVYVGGTDTLQLGGGGTDGGASTSATLATLIQNRRRDGRTVTLTQASQGPAPGRQAAATNGPLIYVQSAAIATGNITGTLFSAATGGSAITTTTAAWDFAATLLVEFTSTYGGSLE